ncbi:hypothetical protein [Mycobacteroides abscessus]|uniref:hypothetical protein n=1 Tax=Mycobacteroides abscessus TaxID=36809 RepID=UPI0002DFD790|nr:hypothetical protein [Mycobacteroides abscessus]
MSAIVVAEASTTPLVDVQMMSVAGVILSGVVDHSGAVERRIPAKRSTRVRDYTLMVRRPGKPWAADAYRFYTEDDAAEAQRWAAEVGSVVTPLG